jgi:hypothetical protein
LHFGLARLREVKNGKSVLTRFTLTLDEKDGGQRVVDLMADNSSEQKRWVAGLMEWQEYALFATATKHSMSQRPSDVS